jgi:flavin-dependent dehydrogenase
MTDLFDIAVIGGGPAGTSAAITAARRGHRVLLLERGKFPRQKVCGEFVSSEALQLLQGLLNGANTWTQTPLKISRARIFIDGKIRETKIEAAANSIPRFVMDIALWQAAEKESVSTMQEAAVQEISGNGPFRISTSTDSFAAATVINATGRWSNLAEDMRLPKLDASMGLKQHFRELAPASSVDLYFFDGGYCGVQPIGANEVNVSSMVLPSIAKNLETVFQQDLRLRERSQLWTPTTEAVSTYPLVHGKPLPVQMNRNILNAGDAAGFIDPFVGDGISVALHSGRMAAECLSRCLDGRCSIAEAVHAYRATYEESLLPAFRNAARLRKLIASPSLRSVAMKLFSIPAISQFALRKTRARIA